MTSRILEFFGQSDQKLRKLEDLPLLFMRLVLAYGFWIPATMKLANMPEVISWFSSLGIPLPGVNAYLAAYSEIIGVFLLLFGFGTRVIAIPLIVDMLVAVFTVHITHGFQAGNNGFEIPLYYLIMLFALLVYGPGKYSVTGILIRYREKKPYLKTD